MCRINAKTKDIKTQKMAILSLRNKDRLTENEKNDTMHYARKHKFKTFMGKTHKKKVVQKTPSSKKKRNKNTSKPINFLFIFPIKQQVFKKKKK